MIRMPMTRWRISWPLVARVGSGTSVLPTRTGCPRSMSAQIRRAGDAGESSGPRVMASLRNLAITAARLTGVTNIAASIRYQARRPDRP
jgi:hypothetical protein